MTDANLVVIISAAIIIATVIASAAAKSKKVPVYAILFAFVILLAGLTFRNTSLNKALILGTITGSLLQPAIADRFLIKRTLIYQNQGWRFLKTPWWMALLWGLALTHLTYLCFRLNELLSSPWSYFLFLAAGTIYFYAFEWLVSNHAHWWRRKNCWQPLGVAFYASVAEIITVVIIILSGSLLSRLSLWQNIKHIIAIAVLEGIAIATAFILCCAFFYQKPTDM